MPMRARLYIAAIERTADMHVGTSSARSGTTALERGLTGGGGYQGSLRQNALSRSGYLGRYHDTRSRPGLQRRENEKPRRSGAFDGADDGTRTHDLLHGKQTL
jgi:hypothetical protein